MLGVQVGLVAVRTREFPIGILCRNGGVFGSRPVDTVGDGGGTTRDTGKDTATALRAHNLGARGILWGIGGAAIGPGDRVGIHPGTSLAITVAKGTRGQAGIVCAAIPRRRGGNGLRVALGTGSGRQHAMRWRIGLRRLSLLSLRVRMREEGRRRQTPNSGVRHDRRGGRRVNIMSGRSGKPGQVGTVGRLAHIRMRRRRLIVMGLQWRQGMWLRNGILRLHGVLRHRHAGDGGGGQRRGTLGQASGGRPGGMRTRIHRGRITRNTRSLLVVVVIEVVGGG